MSIHTNQMELAGDLLQDLATMCEVSHHPHTPALCAVEIASACEV